MSKLSCLEFTQFNLIYLAFIVHLNQKLQIEMPCVTFADFNTKYIYIYKHMLNINTKHSCTVNPNIKEGKFTF